MEVPLLVRAGICDVQKPWSSSTQQGAQTYVATQKFGPADIARSNAVGADRVLMRGWGSCSSLRMGLKESGSEPELRGSSIALRWAAHILPRGVGNEFIRK